MVRIAEIDRAILAEKLRKKSRFQKFPIIECFKPEVLTHSSPSRMSYVELAKLVGASERTVRTHVRRMEEMGTIRGYTIREGGVGLTALIRIKVSPGAEIGTFAGEVTGWEGVEILYEVHISKEFVLHWNILMRLNIN